MKRLTCKLEFYKDYSSKELSQDLKIDFYLYNQCKQIYENLHETPILYENVVTLRKKQLFQACESEQHIGNPLSTLLV